MWKVKWRFPNGIDKLKSYTAKDDDDLRDVKQRIWDVGCILVSVEKAVVNTGISNTYGYVKAYGEDGKYYLSLDDYSGGMRKEISEELYAMLDQEFN